MKDDFQLPGAENFSKYLHETLEGELTAEGPEIVDTSYNGKFGKMWMVKLDGLKIGEYLTFGPKPKESEFGRQYNGRIPGYNKDKEIILSFSNSRFEAELSHIGPGKLVETPWQRQDGHDKIPFP